MPPGKRVCLPARSSWKRSRSRGARRYAHQNEDIVRLTPEQQLKAKMAAKEAAAAPNAANVTDTAAAE